MRCVERRAVATRSMARWIILTPVSLDTKILKTLNIQNKKCKTINLVVFTVNLMCF